MRKESIIIRGTFYTTDKISESTVLLHSLHHTTLLSEVCIINANCVFIETHNTFTFSEQSCAILSNEQHMHQIIENIRHIHILKHQTFAGKICNPKHSTQCKHIAATLAVKLKNSFKTTKDQQSLVLQEKKS